MFGSLLGHLKQAKMTLKSEADSDKQKRKESLEQRVIEKMKEEKQSATQKARQKIIDEKLEKEQERINYIKETEEKQIQLLTLIRIEHDGKLSNFFTD